MRITICDINALMTNPVSYCNCGKPEVDLILSILVYTFFTRMFDFMLPLVVKYSIVAA